MKIAIGVDTGGTYTDAVLYDFDEKKILAGAKALTTKEDLCIGIANALDALPQELFARVRMVSLSTTLATNACVENKGGNAKLIFFGGDKVILDRYGAQYGLPPSSEIWIPPCKTGLDGSIPQPPDWKKFEKEAPAFLKNAEGVGVIELYAMRNNAVIEKGAKERLQNLSDVPVTCGCELFNELNSLQRGAGTLLNAQLYPVIRDFIRAVEKVMKARGLAAPVVIMRSDGSLMSEQFARLHPVETLLCGPAASVMGGFGLTDEKNAVIVDMGGTTTDIAVVVDGIPVRAGDGVSIGKWRTYVNGLMIRTFGLGGDSAVRYRDRKLVLEEFRAIPLCVAAARWPQIGTRLQQLVDEGKIVHSHFRHEFYALAKEPDLARLTEEERALCRALEDGPLILEDAAAAMGKDLYTFRIPRLLKEGTVQVIGLTPTDVMHVRGDFERFDGSVSRMAAEIVAGNLEIATEQLCERVYAEIRHKMYVNIVKIILQYQDGFYKNGKFGEESDHWIEECYRTALGKGRGVAQAELKTNFKLVGIGAPVGLFLPEVARLLGTTAVIPEHAEVANAVGAVTGNVYAACTAEIRQKTGEGFIVYGNAETREFETLEDAEAFAAADAESAARAEAKARGAAGEISVVTRSEYSTSATQYDDDEEKLFLGAVVTAEAIGSVGFTK